MRCVRPTSVLSIYFISFPFWALGARHEMTNAVTNEMPWVDFMTCETGPEKKEPVHTEDDAADKTFASKTREDSPERRNEKLSTKSMNSNPHQNGVSQVRAVRKVTHGNKRGQRRPKPSPEMTNGTQHLLT